MNHMCVWGGGIDIISTHIEHVMHLCIRDKEMGVWCHQPRSIDVLHHLEGWAGVTKSLLSLYTV